jgi:hypothetical protein
MGIRIRRRNDGSEGKMKEKLFIAAAAVCCWSIFYLIPLGVVV